MKKTLLGLFILSMLFILTACSKGTLPASVGNLSFNYDSKVWKYIKNSDENAPLEFKDKHDNKLVFNVSQESTYQHPMTMISFIESMMSDAEGFEVFQAPNKIIVNDTEWYEYGYVYKDGSASYKVYQRYYGKYYNAASISYTSTPDKYDAGYEEAIKLMSDIQAEEVSNKENEAKAKEFLVGEWDMDQKGYLVLSKEGTYRWYMDSKKDEKNMHYGTYGCDIENANMNLVEGDGLYLALFPEGLVINGDTDTAVQYKIDYLVSLKDEEDGSYPMVNISNYTLYTLTRRNPGPAAQADDSHYEVAVERVDKSVLADDGQTLAYIYFDKPVVSGDSDAAAKINIFFEQACDEWFGENADGNASASNAQFLENRVPLDEFLTTLDDYRERFDDAEIVQPGYSLKHILHSKVTLSDPDTLSIMHISDWYVGGGRYFRVYGSTFDLKTGELVPSPFDPDDSALKEKLMSVFPSYAGMRITDKYYRDKDSIYVIVEGRDDYTIKWNGKTGEDFEAEWLDLHLLDELPD